MILGFSGEWILLGATAALLSVSGALVLPRLEPLPKLSNEFMDWRAAASDWDPFSRSYKAAFLNGCFSGAAAASSATLRTETEWERHKTLELERWQAGAARVLFGWAVLLLAAGAIRVAKHRSVFGATLTIAGMVAVLLAYSLWWGAEGGYAQDMLLRGQLAERCDLSVPPGAPRF